MEKHHSNSFASRVGSGGRTFGRNKHLGATKVTDVVSEITGLKQGRIIEHGSGRVDAEHQALTLTVTAEQVWGSYKEGRAWVYNSLRESGYSHSEAMRRMSRERL